MMLAEVKQAPRTRLKVCRMQNCDTCEHFIKNTTSVYIPLGDMEGTVGMNARMYCREMSEEFGKQWITKSNNCERYRWNGDML